MSAGTAKPVTWPMWRAPAAYGHAGATRIFSGAGFDTSFGRFGGGRRRRNHTNRPAAAPRGEEHARATGEAPRGGEDEHRERERSAVAASPPWRGSDAR